MEADRGYPQAATAHDTFWDFIGLMPESMHMIMWAMSDRTIPRSLRMMEGFGVHATTRCCKAACSLSKVTLPHIRQKILANLLNVDTTLARKVGVGLGVVELPPAASTTIQPTDLPLANSLRLIGKYEAGPDGRCLGLLVTDGADAKNTAKLKHAAIKAGMKVVVIATRIEGAMLSDGVRLPADAQLAGAPSCLFDAVAVMASAEGCAELLKMGAAIDFVKDAYAHLKAIGLSKEAHPLADKAGLKPDTFVMRLAADGQDLIQKSSHRLWEREPKIRPAL